MLSDADSDDIPHDLASTHSTSHVHLEHALTNNGRAVTYAALRELDAIAKAADSNKRSSLTRSNGKAVAAKEDTMKTIEI